MTPNEDDSFSGSFLDFSVMFHLLTFPNIDLYTNAAKVIFSLGTDMMLSYN